MPINKTEVDFAAKGKVAGARFRLLWPYSHVSTVALELAWGDLEWLTPLSVRMSAEEQRIFFAAFLEAAGEPRVPENVKKYVP
jgi:hypothetical protein